MDELPSHLLDDICIQVAKYSTGLILNDKFIGSGTFVSWGMRYGVLTAEHVLKNPFSNELSVEFDPSSRQRLGLVIADYAHSFSYETRLLECVSVGKRESDEFGPDLAIVVLPESAQLGEVKARKSFWNISENTQDKTRKALQTDGIVMVAGLPAETLRAGEPELGFKETVEMHGLVGATWLHKHFEMGAFDYVEVGSAHGKMTKPPSSFGGVSGGGLWTVPLYRESKSSKIIFDEFYLLGVPFFQSAEEEGRRMLRGHGPKTIYERLAPILPS